MHGRVYYLGMIVTDAYGQTVGAKTFTGAASNKMIAIAKAMRNQGEDATIISMPFVGAAASRFFMPSVWLEDGGVPIEFLSTYRSSVLRKLHGTLVFGIRAFSIEKNAKVIVYNHSMEYLIALLVLRLRSIPVVHDIEDAPTIDERGLKKFLSYFSFLLTNLLTLKKKMVVADHVAKKLNIHDYVVIPGVAVEPVHINPHKWNNFKNGGALILHFGGTLNRSTGIDLFCDAIKILSVSQLLMNSAIEFNVTGIGELGKIKTLQQAVHGSSKIRVNLHMKLNKVEYQKLFGQSHGSLSLRDPLADYSNTTFPSKVIEITSNGLALISSKQGDVQKIYSNESALFIERYDPECLASLIISIASNSRDTEIVASKGKDIAMLNFSAPVIVSKILTLF